MDSKKVHVSEQEAMKVAEDSRQKEWNQPSFMREMFLGNFRLDLIHPYPLEEKERPEFAAFFGAMKEFLRDHVDAEEIDATGEYPEDVLDGLKKLGAFGMKIPKKYGGLGFSQVEYGKVMELLGAVCGNLTALLSAHQSVCPSPSSCSARRNRRRNTCRAAPPARFPPLPSPSRMWAPIPRG